MASESKSVETRDLKVGDILFHTGDVVMTTPVSLTNTPRRKLEFVVKTKKGIFVSKVWNRHTLILINK